MIFSISPTSNKDFFSLFLSSQEIRGTEILVFLFQKGSSLYIISRKKAYAYIDMGNKITACDDDYKEYTIPPEEAGKYIYTQDDDFLACEVDRVAYWRSNHDVSDFFYENIKGEVKNTGYYRLNTKILQKFNKMAAQLDSEPLPVEKPTKRVALF